MDEQERRTVGRGRGSGKNSAGRSAREEASSATNEALTKIPRWMVVGPLLAAYHAGEWGIPVCTRASVYERPCLEVFRVGLSWLTMLRKKEAFREAFAEFDPEAAAEFGEKDAKRPLTDSAIIRNRVKIEVTMHGARATLTLREFGGLPSLAWSFRPGADIFPERSEDIPQHTPESSMMAAALRGRGFRFVGPTACFALTLVMGMIDGHLVGSYKRRRSGVWEGEWPGGPEMYPGVEPLKYHETWGRLRAV